MSKNTKKENLRKGLDIIDVYLLGLLATLIMGCLKVGGVLSLSWWIVLAPVLIEAASIVLLLLFILAMGIYIVHMDADLVD